MVRASETYGYPLGKLCSIVRVDDIRKGDPWKSVCGWFSAHALWDEIPIRNHAATVVQSMVRFSRCKVAA